MNNHFKSEHFLKPLKHFSAYLFTLEITYYFTFVLQNPVVFMIWKKWIQIGLLLKSQLIMIHTDLITSFPGIPII